MVAVENTGGKMGMTRAKRRVAVPAMLALLVGGSMTAAHGTGTEDATLSAVADGTFTAEEIDVVDGLIFGTGDFADEIGNSLETAMDRKEFSAYEAEAAELRDELLAENPREVRAALDQITSGNVNHVESGLKSLGDTMVAFAEEQTDEAIARGDIDAATVEQIADGSGEVSPNVCTPATFCAIGWALYAAVVAHNTVAVTGLAAVVVGGYLWCGIETGCSAGAGTASQRGATDTVAYERFISLTTRAAAA